jgi:hypothetical protein
MLKVQRLLVISAGYVAASIVAGVVSLLSIVVANVGVVALRPEALAEMVGPMRDLSAVAAAVAFLPTLPIGLYAERKGMRALMWYARAGVGIGLAALLLYVIASELVTRSISKASAGDITFLASLAACVMLAGLCAGATYWAIAGRLAGVAPLSQNPQKT